MSAPRFPFTLRATEEGAVVTMDCGGGVFRSRGMPATILRDLVDACGEIRTAVIDRYRASGGVPPQFPTCVNLGGGTVGPCTVRVTASRHGDVPEFAVAFYDEGDDSAPALLLIDDQLDDFIARGAAVLAELDAGIPPTAND